jgi:diguanylate cyclase (GGDEF)-like protein
MNPPKSILVIIIIFCFCFAEGLEAFGQYSFDSWTTESGLPQNGLREITQTPDGYLWFTTFDGLVRFDGVKFTAFNKTNTDGGIINNRFTGLYSDTDGTLYATTMEDGILTIYRNGVFSSYTSEQVPGHYINLIEPDESGELRFLVEDDGRTSKSWYYLRNGKFEFSEKQDNKNSKFVYHGKSGTVWTLSATEITESLNGKVTVYPHKFESFDSTIQMFEDSEQGLWVGGKTLTYLKKGKIDNFGEKDGFPANSEFSSFRQETDGSIWFANGGRIAAGLGLIRYQAGKFENFGKKVGLSESSIFDVFYDREGITWLATNKGLNQLRRSIISGYSTGSGLNSSEVYPIYRDRQENILIGTTKGLNIYRNGKFESLNLKQSPKQQLEKENTWQNDKMSIQSLFEDSNGKLWIGIDGGIYIKGNGTEVELLEKTAGSHVSAINSDNSGNVWAATNRGLLQFKDYKFVAAYSTKDGLPNEFMTTILNDSKGRSWFGGYGGLSEYKDGKFINYTANEGLTGNHVRTIYEDDEGTLWIGTYDEGMSRFKNGQFVNYNESNGLYNNGVFAIQPDRKGNFWISSNRGIYRVKRQDLNDFADGKINRITDVDYGEEDGMLSTECNGGRQPASITDKDGKMWFPTQEGVAVVDSDAETSNPLPPPVVIENVTVDRKPMNFSHGIDIEAGQRNIEIHYTGLSLIKSDQIKFQYKLDGHDSDWIAADTQRTAYYSYLPPGNYTFQVKAANSDGIWNEKSATVGINLKPFFYQTMSFYLLCVAFGSLCLFLIWQFSVYQLKSSERRLTKLVAERTAELAGANDILQRLANSDGLTKIGNRRRFENFLSDEWSRAVRFKTEISLIIIDIDHFKLFNDTYGHQAGDDCLQKVAEALAGTVNRPTDLAARFGGEEFAIVLGGTDAKGAKTVAAQAVKTIKDLKIPHGKSETNEYLTISVGVVTAFATFDINQSDLINAADKSLYQAKEAGRDQIVSYEFPKQSAKNNSASSNNYVYAHRQTSESLSLKP